eukprot:8594064-Alexandrium_andersonii.AAC.1
MPLAPEAPAGGVRGAVAPSEKLQELFSPFTKNSPYSPAPDFPAGLSPPSGTPPAPHSGQGAILA